MPLRSKGGYVGVKDNKKMLEETGNPGLNRQQGINFYSCSKDWGGIITYDKNVSSLACRDF